MQLKALFIFFGAIASVLAAELYPLPYESDRPIQNRIRRDCTSTQLSPCKYLHRGSYRTATAYSETATSTKKLDCGGCTAVAMEQEHCPERGWVVRPPWTTTTLPTETMTTEVCWETPVWAGLD